MPESEADIVYLDPVEDDSSMESPVDVAAVSPHGDLCEGCGAPIDELDSFCSSCGATHTPHAATVPEVVIEATVAAPRQKFFRCENCSSEVGVDPDQRSYVCTFCDSTYVAEFSPDVSSRQEPEFVIGFAVTPDEAREKFRQWITQNKWFRPGDLSVAAVADKQRGVYLPFWSFSMLAESAWSASIGEYWYRTETYRTRENGKWVTKTRRVRETEWWPLSGKHHRYYSGYLVSGSRGLSQSDADRIKPFQLPALKRYQPYFLAGWVCEEYSVARDQALQMSQDEFYRREHSNVGRFMPGNTHRNLDVTTTFSKISSDLCLLPVYVLTYKYGDKLFRFLVNGQTGKVAGDKPVSWKKVSWVIFGVIGAIAAIIVLIMMSGALAAMF